MAYGIRVTLYHSPDENLSDEGVLSGVDSDFTLLEDAASVHLDIKDAAACYDQLLDILAQG